ncbi:hypothetical protein [Saprospira grandis]|uniref:hypothetical protein n=1 Tax=Saprospira grandis TaxID=1008 RepID=UPI0022DDF26F|nr:hypothetical protein [Saprospira grandis]WBM73513.1 hypothetical protein OP864_11000 [Saprospira grandis]
MPRLFSFSFLRPAGCFLGAAPAFGWVGLCRSSQVCSALRRLWRLGLAFGHCYPSLSQGASRLPDRLKGYGFALAWVLDSQGFALCPKSSILWFYSLYFLHLIG